jgi:DNA-binding NtrC family response regulator
MDRVPSRHVLVVEDDEAIGDLLGDILDRDYTVLRATGAEAALDILGRQQVDVVLLDYRLPDGSGQEVANQADESGIPMIWITGDPAAVRVLDDDPHLVLPKPFGLLGIKDVLARMLRDAPRH